MITPRRLYDRSVLSDCDLELLPDTEGASPVVRVRWHEGPIPVPAHTRAVPGDPRVITRWHRTGYVIDLTEASLRILMDHSGHELDVHFTSAVAREPAALSLTTALLSRLPQLWGGLVLHAATLDSPQGIVVICGSTGAGKSTLAQYLVMSGGWSILDDDACWLRLTERGLRITPMGGYPRLRADAAARLGVSGEAVQGRAQTKFRLSAADSEALTRAHDQPVAGFVHLKNPEVTTREISNDPRLMVNLAQSSLIIDPTTPGFLAQAMRIGAAAAAHRHLVIPVVPGDPAATARMALSYWL